MKHIGCLLVCGILTLTSARAQIVLTIAYEDKEQPPYYMGNTHEVLASKPGVAVEMVQALATKIPEIQIRLVRMPWARCLAGLATNTWDGIFNASYSRDRLSIGWYPTTDGSHAGPVDESKRITTIAYSLYARKDSNLEWNGRILVGSPKELAAPQGYSIVADLKNLGIGVIEVPGTTNIMSMMAAGRVAGAALQDITADSIIRKNPATYAAIKKIEPPLVQKAYFLMLSHQFVSRNPELAQRIWQVLKEMRETEFGALVAKYLD